VTVTSLVLPPDIVSAVHRELDKIWFDLKVTVPTDNDNWSSHRRMIPKFLSSILSTESKVTRTEIIAENPPIEKDNKEFCVCSDFQYFRTHDPHASLFPLFVFIRSKLTNTPPPKTKVQNCTQQQASQCCKQSQSQCCSASSWHLTGSTWNTRISLSVSPIN
jgi:hypothetical protein